MKIWCAGIAQVGAADRASFARQNNQLLYARASSELAMKLPCFVRHALASLPL